MAVNWGALWSRQPQEVLNALLPNSQQRVLLDIRARQHVGKHCQTKPHSTEAGGQLFGVVTGDEVQVRRATGPYRTDARTRYGYRSDPERAQREIATQAKRGLVYLGEWHTHAEDLPEPSMSDTDAMRMLCRRSSLNTNSLLLLIVGRIPGRDGFALCLCNDEDLVRLDFC